MRKGFICGNWKMNLTPEQAENLVQELQKEQWSDVDVLIAPPFVSLDRVGKALDGRIFLSSQNISEYDDGAYTGEISAKMLKNLGVTHTLIGHSERRTLFGETDEVVCSKVKKAIGEGLHVILCVGEEEKTRQEGKQDEFVAEQVRAALNECDFDERKVTVAYEPIWAIGTGNTCAAEDAQEMCANIRKTIAQIKGAQVAENIRILYGGSVKPSNISELMANSDIDGALVGGASLKAEDFLGIIHYER